MSVEDGAAVVEKMALEVVEAGAAAAVDSSEDAAVEVAGAAVEAGVRFKLNEFRPAPFPATPAVNAAVLVAELEPAVADAGSAAEPEEPLAMALMVHESPSQTHAVPSDTACQTTVPALQSANWLEPLQTSAPSTEQLCRACRG